MVGHVQGYIVTSKKGVLIPSAVPKIEFQFDADGTRAAKLFFGQSYWSSKLPLNAGYQAYADARSKGYLMPTKYQDETALMAHVKARKKKLTYRLDGLIPNWRSWEQRWIQDQQEDARAKGKQFSYKTATSNTQSDDAPTLRQFRIAVGLDKKAAVRKNASAAKQMIKNKARKKAATTAKAKKQLKLPLSSNMKKRKAKKTAVLSDQDVINAFDSPITPVRHKKSSARTGSSIAAFAKESIKKIARRAGAKRISAMLIPEVRSAAKGFLDNLIGDAIKYAEHARRNTVTVQDVIEALRRNGQKLYGY